MIVGGKRMVCKTTVCAAEVKGIRWAVLLSQELNLRKVVTEGDSKDLYQCYYQNFERERPISVPWQAICIVEDTCDMAKIVESNGILLDKS